ncbi:MAG: hypothetical protein MUE56_04725 [Ignavibacteria bacterium]|jgi:hypothetical protein|nr:hypothetical protein [Ignavibacteria bacterium]
MKNFIVLAIAVFLLLSCGICKKYFDDKPTKKSESREENRDSENRKTEEQKSAAEDISKDIETDKVRIQSLEMLSFDKSDLPSGIKYSGNIVTGKRWNDKNGENILILTKTNIKKKRVKNSDFDDYILECELFGYHYVSIGGSYSLLWKINDFVNDCPLDLTLEFIPGSLTITDINDNGIAESTFLYKMACRGDVSPCDLKLMMHENDSKYALRGTTHLKIDVINEGGSYKVDKSFDTAPDGFLDYAKEQWKKFKEERLN